MSALSLISSPRSTWHKTGLKASHLNPKPYTFLKTNACTSSQIQYFELLLQLNGFLRLSRKTLSYRRVITIHDQAIRAPMKKTLTNELTSGATQSKDPLADTCVSSLDIIFARPTSAILAAPSLVSRMLADFRSCTAAKTTSS